MATIKITNIVKNHDFFKLQMAVTKKYLTKDQKKLWELLIPCKVIQERPSGAF